MLQLKAKDISGLLAAATEGRFGQKAELLQNWI